MSTDDDNDENNDIFVLLEYLLLLKETRDYNREIERIDNQLHVLEAQKLIKELQDDSWKYEE